MALFFLLFANFSQAFAADAKGVICLGENLAIDLSEHSSRLHIQINDGNAIYFSKPYLGPQIVANDLNTKQSHLVKIFFDHQLVHFFQVDFPKTNAVLIWRAKGAWKYKSIPIKKCSKKT